MKNNRTTALLMLLVFLLVVAVVIIFLTGLDRTSARDNPYETVTSTAEPVITPEAPPAEVSAEPTPAATSAPVYYPASTSTPVSTAAPVSTARPASAAATPAPAVQATPTPTPTDANGNPLFSAQDLIPVVPGAATPSPDGSGSSGTSIPVGTNIGSGSFRSDTGTGLNIRADWSAAISGQDTADITVTVYADCYSLYTTATPGALNIAVDGQYVSLASPAIERDGTAGAGSVEINSDLYRAPHIGRPPRDSAGCRLALPGFLQRGKPRHHRMRRKHLAEPLKQSRPAALRRGNASVFRL